MSADLRTPTVTRLDFDPARDGFSFGNSFTWTDDDLASLSGALGTLALAPFALAGGAGGLVAGRKRAGLAGAAAGALAGRVGGAEAAVRGVAQRWSTFGLCGGMALTAIERWPSRPGTLATSELQGGPMRALLRKRQERTLRASLPRFAGWWLRARAARNPDGWAAIEGELDRIERRLGDGRPALLGLVGDAPDPFALHQVVAFGVERRGPLDATVEVYDPNAPGQTRTVTVAPSDTAGRAVVTTSLPTGRRPDGRCHISTSAGRLAHVFVIDVG